MPRITQISVATVRNPVVEAGVSPAIRRISHPPRLPPQAFSDDRKNRRFGGTRSVASKFLHSAIHNPKSEIHFSTVTAVFTELAMKQLSWAA